MNSNEIAQKFSKGIACGFWLTSKQADWLLNVSHQESGQPTTHFGRRSGKGEFRNDTGLYRWEASEGYHGSAFLKVQKVDETQPEVNPFVAFIESKGYDFMTIATQNPQLMAKLTIEWGESLKAA